MTTPQEVLLENLNNLGKDDFENFKWYLCQEGVLEGFKSIQPYLLEEADRRKTVTLILNTYNTDALIVTREVFKKINRNDLVQKISASIKEPTDPERSKEERGQPERGQPEDWLKPVWTDLINRLSNVNINQLLDRLYQQDIINQQERDDVMEEKTTADKARKLIKEVQNKGPDAVSRLKTALHEVNPSLCKTLKLT